MILCYGTLSISLKMRWQNDSILNEHDNRTHHAKCTDISLYRGDTPI